MEHELVNLGGRRSTENVAGNDVAMDLSRLSMATPPVQVLGPRVPIGLMDPAYLREADTVQPVAAYDWKQWNRPVESLEIVLSTAPWREQGADEKPRTPPPVNTRYLPFAHFRNGDQTSSTETHKLAKGWPYVKAKLDQASLTPVSGLHAQLSTN
jgi:hypothetical protein